MLYFFLACSGLFISIMCNCDDHSFSFIESGLPVEALQYYQMSVERVCSTGNQDTIVWGEVVLIGVQNHHKIGMLQILSHSVRGTCTSSVHSAFSVHVSRHGVTGRTVQNRAHIFILCTIFFFLHGRKINCSFAVMHKNKTKNFLLNLHVFVVH